MKGFSLRVINNTEVVLLVQKANKQQMKVHLLYSMEFKTMSHYFILAIYFISPIAPKLYNRQILVFYSSEFITVY